MYRQLKKIAFALLPSSLIERNRDALRKLAALPYRGNRHECNICSTRLRKFVGPDKICPRCGALARTRRLFTLSSAEIERKPRASVLHFSPSAAVAAKIDKTFPNIEYLRSDFVGEFAADSFIDLRDTRLPDNSFDLILCYHVLEHIDEDQKAMRELARILKLDGSCFIQTPFYAKNGPAIEDETVVTPAGRLEKFGQEDHVRVYSVEELERRLSNNGLKVEVMTFSECSPNQFGYSAGETILRASLE